MHLYRCRSPAKVSRNSSLPEPLRVTSTELDSVVWTWVSLVTVDGLRRALTSTVSPPPTGQVSRTRANRAAGLAGWTFLELETLEEVGDGEVKEEDVEEEDEKEENSKRVMLMR